MQAALLDGGKVTPSDMVKSEEEQPVPRHCQHGWNFYREKHKNAWNNLWSVPPSRLKFVASKASNDCKQQRTRLSPLSSLLRR